MSDLWAALCLVLVIEGVLPFVSPRGWREAMLNLSELDDRTIRWIGLAAMIAGLLLLQLVRGEG